MSHGDGRGRLHQVMEYSTAAFSWDPVPDLSGLLDPELDGDTMEGMVEDPPLPVVDEGPHQGRETDSESVRRTVSKLISIMLSTLY